MGRLLSRDDGALRAYRCSNCGATGGGLTRSGTRMHPAICACAIRFGSRDAGIRCIVNPKRTPEVPSEIIAVDMADMGGNLG